MCWHSCYPFHRAGSCMVAMCEKVLEEAGCCGSMLGITRRDRWQNQAVLQRCGQRPMQQILRQRRLQWLGHCHRMADSRLPKQMLTAQLPGTRPAGKPPRRSREDAILNDVTEVGLAQGRWLKVAPHRTPWHRAARGENVDPRSLPRK